jgi:FkbM family methyltransferase
VPQKVLARLLEIVAAARPGHAPRVVLDVGARDCRESVDFAAAFPAATVYAFECNPATLPACRAAAAAEPRIRLVEKAATDADGRTAFFPIDQARTVTGSADGNPGASSLFEASGDYPLEHYVQGRIDVESTRLDTFLAREGVAHVDVLWMDVQGAELLVLRGLGGRLADVDFIHLEAEQFEIYRGQALFPAIDAHLAAHGFELAGSTSYSIYAVDALYCSRRLGVSRRKLWSAFPYLRRNWLKLHKHRVKRWLRRRVGLPEWPRAGARGS